MLPMKHIAWQIALGLTWPYILAAIALGFVVLNRCRDAWSVELWSLYFLVCAPIIPWNSMVLGRILSRDKYHPLISLISLALSVLISGVAVIGSIQCFHFGLRCLC
jgi:hypothetical protein